MALQGSNAIGLFMGRLDEEMKERVHALSLHVFSDRNTKIKLIVHSLSTSANYRVPFAKNALHKEILCITMIQVDFLSMPFHSLTKAYDDPSCRF